MPSHSIPPGVVLKPGKDKPLRQRHHWIFSGAVASFPSFNDGECLPVYSSQGDCLGTGYFNRASGIVGRMLSFDTTPPLEAIALRLEAATALRSLWFPEGGSTNSYRLVNGEGDALPGLIIDRYDAVFVLQSSTKGMDLLKSHVATWLQEKFRPKAIYEKSLLPSRAEEKLSTVQGFITGHVEGDIFFKENGFNFATNLEKSQKTGFFLDQREMRLFVKELSKGKRVLNAFSYSGGFTVYANAGGASTVDSVDISKEALAMAKRNVALNGQEGDHLQFIPADVFEFLRQSAMQYDLTILDPPAFAKKRGDVIPACRGYKDLNRIAMQKMPAGSLLLTCSCSYFVDEELFQKVLFQAALEAKRDVRIVGRHRLAPDHPINLFHPEGNYLKSFLLYIE